MSPPYRALLSSMSADAGSSSTAPETYVGRWVAQLAAALDSHKPPVGAVGDSSVLRGSGQSVWAVHPLTSRVGPLLQSALSSTTRSGPCVAAVVAAVVELSHASSGVSDSVSSAVMWLVTTHVMPVDPSAALQGLMAATASAASSTPSARVFWRRMLVRVAQLWSPVACAVTSAMLATPDSSTLFTVVVACSVPEFLMAVTPSIVGVVSIDALAPLLAVPQPAVPATTVSLTSSTPSAASSPDSKKRGRASDATAQQPPPGTSAVSHLIAEAARHTFRFPDAVPHPCPPPPSSSSSSSSSSCSSPSGAVSATVQLFTALLIRLGAVALSPSAPPPVQVCVTRVIADVAASVDTNVGAAVVLRSLFLDLPVVWHEAVVSGSAADGSSSRQQFWMPWLVRMAAVGDDGDGLRRIVAHAAQRAAFQAAEAGDPTAIDALFSGLVDALPRSRQPVPVVGGVLDALQGLPADVSWDAVSKFVAFASRLVHPISRTSTSADTGASDDADASPVFTQLWLPWLSWMVARPVHLSPTPIGDTPAPPLSSPPPLSVVAAVGDFLGRLPPPVLTAGNTFGVVHLLMRVATRVVTTCVRADGGDTPSFLYVAQLLSMVCTSPGGAVLVFQRLAHWLVDGTDVRSSRDVVTAPTEEEQEAVRRWVAQVMITAAPGCGGGWATLADTLVGVVCGPGLEPMPSKDQLLDTLPRKPTSFRSDCVDACFCRSPELWDVLLHIASAGPVVPPSIQPTCFTALASLIGSWHSVTSSKPIGVIAAASPQTATRLRSTVLALKVILAARWLPSDAAIMVDAVPLLPARDVAATLSTLWPCLGLASVDATQDPPARRAFHAWHRLLKTVLSRHLESCASLYHRLAQLKHV